MWLMKNVARWIVLVSAIVVAAFYLNSAAFSAWVSGGPPNDYPEAWAQRALIQLCFSIAVLLGGMVAFRLISSFPKVGRTTFVLGTLALIVVGLPYGREFLDTDRCVDRGGRWNGLSYRCEK
jgi:hypothetical protein